MLVAKYLRALLKTGCRLTHGSYKNKNGCVNTNENQNDDVSDVIDDRQNKIDVPAIIIYELNDLKKAVLE